MPIKRAEMERGRTMDSLTDRLFNFLQQGRGSAFTADEIAVAVGYVPPSKETDNWLDQISRGYLVGTVGQMLDGWAREGLIDGRLVQGPDGVNRMHYAAK